MSRANKTLDSIYTLRPIEREFSENLEGEDQENFKHFCIGLKSDLPAYRRIYKKDPEQSSRSVVYRWQNDPEGTKQKYIRLGRLNPDPREQQTEAVEVSQRRIEQTGGMNTRRTRRNNTDLVINDAVEHSQVAPRKRGQRTQAWTDPSPPSSPHRPYPPHPTPADPSQHSTSTSHHHSDSQKDYSSPSLAEQEYIVANLEEQSGQGNWSFTKVLYKADVDHKYPRSASLYIQSDRNGNTEIRSVVKRVPCHRKGQLNDFKKEFNLQNRLSQTGSRHMLKVQGATMRDLSARQPPRKGKRQYLIMAYLYSEYAPHGSLHDLLCQDVTDGLFDESLLEQIPEAFIWFVFRSLAKALYTMQTRRNNPMDRYETDDTMLPEPGWSPIVTVDIKPQNIVFGSPIRPYPAYINPKMIDWGLAFIENSDGDYNKKFKVVGHGLGTPGFCPPEQHEKKNDGHKWRINVKSEIWGIGLLIYLMMRKWDKLPDDHLPNFSSKCAEERVPYRFDEEDYTGIYSSRLENLVKVCLSFEQAQRPGLGKLLWETRTGLAMYERVYGKVRGKREVDLAEGLKVKHGKPDLYPVGKRRKIGSD